MYHKRNSGSPQEVLGYEENKPLPGNNLGTVCIKSNSPLILILSPDSLPPELRPHKPKPQNLRSKQISFHTLRVCSVYVGSARRVRRWSLHACLGSGQRTQGHVSHRYQHLSIARKTEPYGEHIFPHSFLHTLNTCKRGNLYTKCKKLKRN